LLQLLQLLLLLSLFPGSQPQAMNQQGGIREAVSRVKHGGKKAG
jgi:hypothetical protein